MRSLAQQHNALREPQIYVRYMSGREIAIYPIDQCDLRLEF
jgi:hypothetical protein